MCSIVTNCWFVRVMRQIGVCLQIWGRSPPLTESFYPATELLCTHCRHLRRMSREMWKYTYNHMDSLHPFTSPLSLSHTHTHTHIHANTPLLTGGLAPSSGLNDIIGCQGYKDTACREKGGWGRGRAMHTHTYTLTHTHTQPEKERREGCWCIGYQKRK